jgi:hypothetical protein
LTAYDYLYTETDGYRVYNRQEDATIERDDKIGTIIIDNTNINLYKTINLFEVIKEETRKQVEISYKNTEGFTGFTNYDASTD